MTPDYKIEGLFPTPLYMAKRDSNLDSTEKKELEDIIENKKKENYRNRNERLEENSEEKISETYIFNTKLGSLKKFCEQHIDTYVNEVINPKNTKLDFYITQSWLNALKPDGTHPVHSHSNSLISGIFYVSTIEGDAIQFYDTNTDVKNVISIEPEEANFWNTEIQNLNIANNHLLLFPSYLGHSVNWNASTTTIRISIAFNVFVKGSIGVTCDLNKLNL